MNVKYYISLKGAQVTKVLGCQVTLVDRPVLELHLSLALPSPFVHVLRRQNTTSLYAPLAPICRSLCSYLSCFVVNPYLSGG